MNFNSVHSVYFIGIGGIGMSALARYFMHAGKAVSGYDLRETPLTNKLAQEGAKVHYIEDINLIPQDIKQDKSGSLIIYTPAIPENHQELQYFKENGFKLYKRAEILGFITQNYRTIAIAGTHGKTSISSMTAHILNGQDTGCYAFLGGILKNKQSNLLLPEKENKEAYAVVEADEYDRSFLKLHPYIALISSMDADHLDIYGDKNNLVKSFEQFVNKIIQNGILIYKKGLNLKHRSDIKQYAYALNETADFYADNIRKNKNGTYRFDFIAKEKVYKDTETAVPGKINLENTVAALSVCYLAGVDIDLIKKRLKTFAGVKRRFDYRILRDDFIYIDDYAHHPQELKAFIGSVKEIFTDKKITGIFQPHLFTRTRDFADEFAESLDMLDKLFLLDIYPARELPIKGVSSELIFNKLRNENKILCTKNEVLDLLKKEQPEVLLSMGAGDIDKLVEPIEQLFNR